MLPWMARLLHSSMLSDFRMRAIPDALAPFLQPGWRVLDVGCGNQRLARLLQERVAAEFEGVDVYVPDGTLPFPLKRYDGRTIPHPDRSFDASLLCDVLHHADDPAALLRETARVSRRLVILKDHHFEGPVDRLKLKAMDWIGNRGYGVSLPYGYKTKDQWRALFRELGLEVAGWVDAIRLYPGLVGAVLPPRLHFACALRV